MAHDINFHNGQHSLMLADNKAWHNLGTVVDGAFTWADCINQVPELNFEVEKRQLGIMLDGIYQQVESWGIFRKDDNQMLGSVGSVYNPIQIKYAFEFVDTLMQAENGAHYESAGVLGNGERFFVTARLPHCDYEVTEGDLHQSYLLFSSSHDGSLAAQAKIVQERVVCSNTLGFALREKGTAARIKHTTNADYKLEQARKMMKKTSMNIKEIEEKLKSLAVRKVEKRTMMNVLNSLFDINLEDEVGTRKKNTIMDILDIYADNDNNAFPQQKGTAFNLLNAITNHTDHKRGVRQTKGRENQSPDQLRADSALFGEGEKFKQKALNTIIKETKNSPVIRPTLYSIPNNAALAASSEKQTAVIEIDPENVTQDAIIAETQKSGSSLLDGILGKTSKLYGN